jgi:DNA-binding transcriptional ArsR family regulator
VEIEIQAKNKGKRMNSTVNAGTQPLIPFYTLMSAIGNPIRAAILGQLSDGEGRMVNELAKQIDSTPGAVSKQLAVLQRAGLVVLNRRLYQVPARFIASREKRHLDFGHCLLRLPDANGQPMM